MQIPKGTKITPTNGQPVQSTAMQPHTIVIKWLEIDDKELDFDDILEVEESRRLADASMTNDMKTADGKNDVDA